jgi:hypothetical protein
LGKQFGLPAGGGKFVSVVASFEVFKVDHGFETTLRQGKLDGAGGVGKAF